MTTERRRVDDGILLAFEGFFSDLLLAQHGMELRLTKQMEKLKMDVNQIKTDIATVKQTILDKVTLVQTDLTGLRTQIQDLKDQLAVGNPVTAQDLTDIDTAVLDLNTSVGQIDVPVTSTTPLVP